MNLSDLTHDLRLRIVADSADRPDWLQKREGKVGASDAASYSKEESAPLYLRSKLHSSFAGNAYTAHGNDRERKMLAHYGIPQNTFMFASAGNPRHVATPDGIVLTDDEIILAQCKTSVHNLTRIPPAYQRQMWWEQYVMGAERTLLIWEHHNDFSPAGMEPESVWFMRSDPDIEKLIRIANYVLDGMDAAEAFAREMKEGH